MKLPILLIIATLSFAHADQVFEEIDASIRDSYLERSQVWHKTNIRALDVWRGPKNEISAVPDTEITCRYVEWEKESTGASPKFNCKNVKTGQVLRVKYGKDNREIFAEAIASRLFWALGFYADEVYSVRIRCLKCPETNPFKPEKTERRLERKFPYAIIERKYPGVIIESVEDQGWAWKELEKIEPAKGGATPDQIGALVLLAVFIQHGDQKPQQQRIGCARQDVRDTNRDGKGECSRPVLMVQDLGSTFGRADQFTSPEAKMEFDLWSEKEVWNKAAEADHYQRTQQRVCIGNLVSSVTAAKEGIDNPVISEGARKFLADLLLQLSDRQIRDLFRVARADKMGEKTKVNDSERSITLEDWIKAFKNKRQQIAERNCSPQ